MDADRRAPAAASSTAAAVLGDDNLLREILLCLGSPHTLVCAALVCKWWLLQVSDPAFLRRFRDHHPPRLLGFYVSHYRWYKFVPLTWHPDPCALSRRAASSCGDAALALRCSWINHCRNGRLISGIFADGRFKYSLWAPLVVGESVAILPPVPLSSLYPTTNPRFTQIFLPEYGRRDGITLVHLWELATRKVYVEVYVLGSGGWSVPTTARTSLGPEYETIYLKEMLPPVRGKVFMTTTHGNLLVLDLATPSFFTQELPVGVQWNYIISCAEESGVHLVNVDGFHLSVWLNRMSNDQDGWILVDTFCVPEACARVVGESWVSQNGDFVWVAALGDNAEFALLDHEASGVIYYVHTRIRVLEKVYQRAENNDRFGRVRIDTVMMPWPPIFLTRNIEHDQEE